MFFYLSPAQSRNPGCKILAKYGQIIFWSFLCQPFVKVGGLLSYQDKCLMKGDFYWKYEASSPIGKANIQRTGIQTIEMLGPFLENSLLFPDFTTDFFCPFYHHSWQTKRTTSKTLSLTLRLIFWGSRRRSSSLWHVKCWATECTSLVSQHLLLRSCKIPLNDLDIVVPPINRNLGNLLWRKQFVDSILKPFANSSQINCDRTVIALNPLTSCLLFKHIIQWWNTVSYPGYPNTSPW